MKRICIPYLHDETGGKALASAAVIASRFKAHIDIVHIRQRITPVLPGNVYSPVIVSNIEENLAILTEDAKQRAAALKSEALKICNDRSIAVIDPTEHTDDKGVTASWTDVEGDVPSDVIKRARTADLTVLSAPTKHRQFWEDARAEDIIFLSGQPVMVTPAGQSMTSFPDTVVVAWDGRREAARALSAAMPILEGARSVFVTAIGELMPGAAEADEAVAVLKLHGVHANYYYRSVHNHERPEEVLLDDAKKRGADLIVMGAYSHQRWRESIIGGFTRYCLKHAQIPLLLAH